MAVFWRILLMINNNTFLVFLGGGGITPWIRHWMVYLSVASEKFQVCQGSLETPCIGFRLLLAA